MSRREYLKRYREENKDKLKAYARKWCKDNKGKLRENHLRNRMKKYGITTEIYSRMLEEQNGKCAICLSDKPYGKGVFNVDHCHVSGKVRGLLCHYCNLGLGNFKDNVAILNNAIDYLKS